jgi:hypothetical protein
MDLNSLKPTSPDARPTFRGGAQGEKGDLTNGVTSVSCFCLPCRSVFPSIEIVEAEWRPGESANQLYLLGTP